MPGDRPSDVERCAVVCWDRLAEPAELEGLKTSVHIPAPPLARFLAPGNPLFEG